MVGVIVINNTISNGLNLLTNAFNWITSNSYFSYILGFIFVTFAIGIIITKIKG